MEASEMKARLNGIKETIGEDLYQDLKSIFSDVLKDPKHRELMAQIPTYFWTIPAASTGKFHPDFAQGDQGLLRHTIMAGQWAIDLLRTNANYRALASDKERTMARTYIMSAILFHDSVKLGLGDSDVDENGKKRFTQDEHPKFARDLYEMVVGESPVSEMIQTHMGVWAHNYWNSWQKKEVNMGLPSNWMAEVVAMADYCSSRKYTLYEPKRDWQTDGGKKDAWLWGTTQEN